MDADVDTCACHPAPLPGGPALDGVALTGIFEAVRAASGVDFVLYRRRVVERRVLSRARAVGVGDLAGYRERLLVDPGEVGKLVAYVTIKVSQFLRDPDVFALLRDSVLPVLLETAGDRPLRIWSAGCGNGEEAYSLALLLGEHVAETGHPAPIIHGTDVDEAALATARAGRYRGAALMDVPSAALARHFTVELDRRGPRYVVAPPVRSWVTFARHDLTSAAAPPAPGQFDLVCCRNVLIYFQPAVQERVQQLLLRALRPGGYLCLGEADGLSSLTRALLVELDRKARLYRRPEEEEWPI